LGDLFELRTIISSIETKDAAADWDNVDGQSSTSTIVDSFQNCMTKLKADYKRLDRLTADQPELNISVKQSQRQLYEADTTIQRAVVRLRQGEVEDVFRTKAQDLPHLRMLFRGAISQDLNIAATHELAVSELSQENQSKIRNQLLDVSLVALCFNVVISLFTAAFLIKKVSARLRIMSENTQLLADGKPLHAPITGDDEIAALDSSFHEMTEKLAQAEQQRQEIISMITHDMRSPLMVIQNSLNLMTETSDSETVQEKLSRFGPMASKNCDRVIALVNDLLDIEKIKSGMMTVEGTKFFVNEIFEEVNESLTEWLAEQNVKLDIKDGDAYVVADKQLVGRLVFNLVSNAVRYAPSGTAITLQAVEAGSSKVVVSVADKGKGIPNEELDTIFERFRQAKDSPLSQSSRTGSGLGLTICRSIAELHGGVIWVESEIGKGTVFYFTLPPA
jgi:Osmosensitive K+ channel histidine kinase